jgi:hypothetical protein
LNRDGDADPPDVWTSFCDAATTVGVGAAGETAVVDAFVKNESSLNPAGFSRDVVRSLFADTV